MVGNYGYRQGTTGSSLGKSVVGFKVINEHTGQPLGIVASTVRQAAHLLDALPGCAGYLLPPWDVRRRTLADK